MHGVSPILGPQPCCALALVSFLLVAVVPDLASAQALVAVSVDVYGDSATASVPSAGGDWNLQLHRVSYRAPGFQILIDTGSALEVADIPAAPTWQGNVEGHPGSFVTAGIVDGRLDAVLHLVDDTWYVNPDRNSESYYVYSLADSPFVAPFQCAVLGPVLGTATPAGTGSTPAGPPLPDVVEVTYDLDFDWLLSFSLDANAAIAQVEIDHGHFQIAFEGPPLSIGHEIRAIVLRTVSGVPYTADTGGSSPDLCDLRDELESVWDGSPLIANGGVQLLTRRATGSLPAPCAPGAGPLDVFGALAYTGTLCADQPYSVVLKGVDPDGLTPSNERTRFIMAHGWGHVWGAEHCCGTDCGIMCADASPCVCTTAPDYTLDFGSAAVAAISAYESTGPCVLTPQLPVIPVPPIEAFWRTVGTLQPPEWTFVQGAQVQAQFFPSVPTPPNILALSTTFSPAADVRTGRFDLSSPGSWRVEFFVLPVGAVGASSTLRVQYRRSDFSWGDLLTFTPGDFASPTTYLFQSVVVPSDAFFDEFRVRFFVAEDGSGGSWTIDNFEVRNGSPPCFPALNPTVVQVLPTNAYVGAEVPINVFGTNFTTDATVTVGTKEYSASDPSQGEFVSSTHLRVFLDATPTAAIGSVDVTVAQCGGSGTLDDGFRYHGNFVFNSQFVTGPGPTVTTQVHAMLTDEILAYSFGVDHGPAVQLVDPTDPTVGSDAEGAWGVFVDIQTTTWTFGVILSDPPVFPLPLTIGPGLRTLAAPQYNVLPPVDSATIVTQEITGVGPVTVNLTDPTGASITPGYVESSVSMPPIVLFERGDANQDDRVDVADAVFTLTYLFEAGPAECLAALDSNADGTVDVADPVYLLQYLFTLGSPPPPPFGVCGWQFPGSAGCESFAACP